MAGVRGLRGLLALLLIGGASPSFLLPVVGPLSSGCRRHFRPLSTSSSLFGADGPHDGTGGGATRRSSPGVQWIIQDVALVALEGGHASVGVTALLLDGQYLYVGTKRGQIFRLCANDLVNHHDGGELLVPTSYELLVAREHPSASSSSTSTSLTQPKLPIYCLATIRSPTSASTSLDIAALLLAGGADRYVSVYRLTQDNENSEDPCPGYQDRVLPTQRVQRLGPHTGWVKDMVLVDEDESVALSKAAADVSETPSASKSSYSKLYSIGCNGIEIWEAGARGDSDGGAHDDENVDDTHWRHRGKYFVDSSPLGCTLSSDILCLAAQDKGAEGRLWAGGVDGRIHGWRTAPPTNDRSRPTRPDGNSSSNNFAAWLAHQGRVTQLIAHQNRLLFSCSHDGTLKCWTVGTNQPPTEEDSPDTAENRPMSSFEVEDDKRVTSMTMLDLGSPTTAYTTLWVAFGTQDGWVGLTRLIVGPGTHADDECHTNWSLLGQVQLPKEPSIHCLCPVGPSVLAAGHANGLSFLSFDVQVE